jgi:hypothetical protein
VKILALILAASAFSVGCDDDGDDFFDDDDDFDNDGDGLPDVVTWSAPIVGFDEFDTIVGDAVVEQTLGAELFTADIAIRGDDPGSVRAWHVHFGTCATGGDIVGDPASYRPLLIDGEGVGVTTARVAFELDLLDDYHVNVHFSPDDLPDIIACGDLFLD